MDFLYMDESGKNIFTDKGNKGYSLYGGIIINQNSVYECLEKFKVVYQKNRDELKKELKKSIVDSPNKTKEDMIRDLLKNYEIHAYYMFNRADPGKNPWCYYDDVLKKQMTHEIVDIALTYIESIFYFKAERESLTNYYDEQKMFVSNDRKAAIKRNNITDEKMIELIVSEFHLWLENNNKKGSIIPD